METENEAFQKASAKDQDQLEMRLLAISSKYKCKYCLKYKCKDNDIHELELMKIAWNLSKKEALEAVEKMIIKQKEELGHDFTEYGTGASIALNDILKEIQSWLEPFSLEKKNVHEKETTEGQK